MPFISNNGTVISFATYDDVVLIDKRLFEANEGLTEDLVDGYLIRSTERIIDDIQVTNWWKTYWIYQSGSAGSSSIVYGINNILVPRPNPNLILGSQNDFSDLCVYFALSNYILPSIADFGNPDSADRQKVGFYNEKYRSLFQTLIDRGDWYDFDDDGQVQTTEQAPALTNLTRVR